MMEMVSSLPSDDIPSCTVPFLIVLARLVSPFDLSVVLLLAEQGLVWFCSFDPLFFSSSSFEYIGLFC